MTEILSNPWVVGIGGGILSGLVVAYISRLIFSRRDNREYAQKVSQANQEILYAIRPGISEGIIPDNDIVKKIINATARKYGVEQSSIHDLDEISSELMKEVMDSSFISASSKQEFCQKLAQIKEDVPEFQRQEVEAEYDKSSRYRRQMIAMLSLMVGLMTAIAGFTISLKSDDVSEPQKLIFLIIPAVVAVLVSILTVLLKEVEKLKIKKMDINVGGLRAEFKARELNEENKT